MGTALRYEQRKAVRKPKWQMPPIGMGVAVLALIAGISLSASIGSSAGISVTDGDTIRVAGHPVRLVGFNTPETFSPACAREQELGDRATRRLEELVAAGDVDFVSVRCSCPPGTEGTSECNYGRACGILRTNGKEVGAILISEGLAVPFRCGATSCPRLPRPWCG